MAGTLVASVLICLMMLLSPAASEAFSNGGDKIWTYRDKIDGQTGKAGKQNPVASVTDSEGNTIITGIQLLPGSNFEEIYTVKITTDGTLAWRGVFKVSGMNARAVAITLDSSNNVYVTGTNDGSNSNVHTIRYNKDQASIDATPAWQQVFDGGGTDKATSIAVSGNYVYVGGSSRYSNNECFMVLAYDKETSLLSWQIPNAATATVGKAAALAANGNGVVITGQSWNGPDNFIKTIAYQTNGQAILWQTTQPATAGFQHNDSGLFVIIDSKGHVVVAGSVFNGSNTDIHTVKYCSSSTSPCDGKTAGTILWQDTYDGGSDDEPNALQLESGTTSKDDVYLTGHTMIGGRYHTYTARFHSAATTPQRSWGQSPIFDSGGDNSDIPAALVVDPAADNLFVVGHSIYNDGSSDFRSVKYRKSTGDELWTQTFHGVADLSDRAIGAGLDQNGHLNVVGYADETRPLDNGVSIASDGSKSGLTDNSKNWATNAWAGYYLMMLTGSNNKDQFRQIQSNSNNSLSFNLLLPDAVANGDNYYLFDKDDYDYYVVKYDKGLLNAPTKLHAVAQSNSSISLSWQDNNAETPKFRVERCTQGTDHLVIAPCNFDDMAQITVIPVDNGQTSTQADGLMPDRYYYFRVRAYTGTDFGSATQVTYPSSTEHAVTQTLATQTVSEANIYRYTGIANSDDYALTIATGPKNGHPVVSGKSLFAGSGFDYYTLQLDKNDLTKLWSQRYDGPESQGDSAMCLAIDTNDQVIVSGYSKMHNLAAERDMNSIYTIKYKADAASTPENNPAFYEWAHQYNSASAIDDRPIAIAAASDNSNNVAVVGMGVHTEAEMGNHDIYVLHYPAAGPGPANARNPGYWAAAAIDKGGNDEPTDVAIDPSGNVVVTGYTMNTTRSRKDYDIYTAKFAAATGALLWERTYDNGFGDDKANSVGIDADGNVYVVGFATNEKGSTDFITIKYDKDGNIQWNGPKFHDGPAQGDDEAVSIKIDPLDNHLVVAGNQLTDPGNNDIHVIRYAPDGSIDWQKTLLREHNDEDMFDMAMDTSGTVHITATTTNSANPDPQSNKDILTVKLDWTGLLSPEAQLFGSADRLDKPYSIAANFLGDVFVAGITQNSQLNADYVVLKIVGDEIQSPYPISFTTPGYKSVTLAWTDVSKSEDGYQVARRDGVCPAVPPQWSDGEIITTAPGHLAANTVSYTDTGLTSRAQYCYGVRSFKGTRYSRWANKTVTMPTPAAPEPIAASALDTSRITVSWTPQNGGQQTGFEIWKCTDASSAACSDYTLLTSALTGAATSFEDTAAVCGGKISRYRLRATGSGWQSDLSAMAAALPPPNSNLAVDPGFEAPDPASDSWKTTVGIETIGVGFDKSTVHSGTTSLRLDATDGQVGKTLGRKQFLALEAGGQYQLSAWFKTNLTAGSAMCDLIDGTWASTAIQLSGINDWTRVSQTITIPATGVNVSNTAMRLRCYAGNAPNGTVYVDDVQLVPLYTLTATRISETEIGLTWVDSAYDESGYIVERCSDAACNSAQVIATTTASTKTYLDQKLTPDQIYWYRVHPYKTASLSCNGGWQGDYSNIASATTTNIPPVLSATAPNTTRVNLAWSDTAGTENQFQLERCTAASCSMGTIANLFFNSTTYNDTSVCSNTAYNYQIRAADQLLSFANGGKWTKKIKLNFGTTFSPNKLVRITLNQLTGMDGTFKDIRFYDATAQQELPHWIEPALTGPTPVWFKTGSSNNIELYFGNSSAVSTSRIFNVFGTGLAGFWPFNETAETRSGTTDDLSGNSLNATLDNFYSDAGYGVVSGGRYGNGLKLGAHNDTSARVADSTGSVLDITDQITVETWYQYQKSDPWARLVSKQTTDGNQPWEMYGLWLDSSVGALPGDPQQRVYFGIGSQDSPPTGTWPYYQSGGGPQLTPGQWYHLVGRYDSATGRMSVFVNGIEYGVATHAAKPKITVNNGALYIGNRVIYNYLKGMLDEVRIYNRYLTDEEIASRYAATLPAVAALVDGNVESESDGYPFVSKWIGPYSSTVQIVTPKPVNLVADSDFDNGSASWSTAVGTSIGTSFDSTVSYSGSKSLKLAATGAELGFSQTVTVVPNSDYTLSAYLKTALTSGSAQCYLSSSGPLTEVMSSGTTAWQYKTKTITIPNGVTSVSVRCSASIGSQGQAWIDMVQLVPAVPVSSFSAVRKSEAQIDLTWTFPTGKDQTGFIIDRCSDSLCASSTPISVVNADVSTATPGSYKKSDKNLPINTTYWYRIRAYKTENPLCNGGKGYWETAATPISGPVETTLNSISLTGSSAVTTDCADLRVTDASTGSPLKFYLENSMPYSACDTVNTKLIVKIPSIPTTGKLLNVYHGNLTALPAHDDGSNVFSFFDDFNGTTLNESKWTAAPATGFSVSGGYLHGTDTSGRLVSTTTDFYGSGWNLQAKVKSTLRPAGGFTALGFSLFDNYYRSFGLVDYPSAHNYFSDGSWTANSTTAPAGSSRDDSMVYSIILKSPSIISPSVFDADRNVAYWGSVDVANSNHASPWNITLGRRYDGAQTGQAYNADWDWVRIRKYADNAPAASTPGTAVKGSYSLLGESGTWNLLRQVSITNNSGAIQTDYQVNVVLDTTSLASDRNTLTWSASTDTETRFVLRRCKDTLGNCTTNFASDTAEKTVPKIPPANSIGSTVKYVDSDLQPDSPTVPINYCYQVKAARYATEQSATAIWETAWSNIVCMATKLQAPPTNLQATGSSTTINLTWTDNTSGETGFKLERCKEPCSLDGGSNSIITIPPNDDKISTAAAYADSNLCSGTYRYRISSFRINPDGTSLPQLGPFPNDSVGIVASTELPPAPTNVTVTRVSEKEAKITWTDNSPDEAGFEVWRCLSPSGKTPGVDSCTNYPADFIKLPIPADASNTPSTGGTVTYNDSYGLIPGSSYRYSVNAYTSGGCGTTSAPSPATAQDYVTLTINAPTTATATPISTTQVNLAWNDGVVSESGYMVGRCSPAPCTTSSATFPPLAVDTVTYNDTSACAGTGYTYSIYPVNTTTFFNPGAEACWKSYSPLTFSHFQPNFITRLTISRDPAIVDGTGIKADFSDIRFFDYYAMKEIPFWIQEITGNSAIVWIKTGLTEHIDLYYGNASATYTAATAKDAVFGTGLGIYVPFEESIQFPASVKDVSSNNTLNMNGFTEPDGIIKDGGIYGNALSLDGVNDYANRNGTVSGLSAGSAVSAEAWIFPKGSSFDYNGIVAWGNRSVATGFGMSIGTSGYPQMPTWANDFFYSTAAVNFNAWNHIAVVADGTTYGTIYLNGVKQRGEYTGTPPKVPNIAAVELVIGSINSAGGSRYFKGLIDEVRTYSRALTDADIASRFAAVLPSVRVGDKATPGGCLPFPTNYTGVARTAHAVTEKPGNLAKNIDFENDLTGWNKWSATNNTAFSADGTVFFSGTKSAKLKEINLPADKGSTIYQLLNGIEPGGTYILSGYINASLSTGGAAWCSLTNWQADIMYGSESINIAASDATKNNKGWFGFSVPITIPAVAPQGGTITSVNLECGIRTSVTGTQSANFDAVQLVPDPPLVLAVPRNSEADAYLTWNNFPAAKDGFNVYRCSGSCSDVINFTNFVKLNTAPLQVNNYLDATLTPGQTYRYVVKAIKAATCPWEINSNVVTINTALNAPVLATPVSLTSTSMKLNWLDTTTSESGYNIYRCTGSGCEPLPCDCSSTACVPSGCTATTPTYTNQSTGISSALNDTLKASYSFNNSMNDSTTNLLHITPHNDPQYDDGGVRLDSFCGDSPSPVTDALDNDAHTISFDIKYNTAITGCDVIFRYPAEGTDRSPGIWACSSNRLYWRYDPGDKGINLGIYGDNSAEFEIGTWYRIRGVKNGSSFKVYVDDQLVHSSTILPAVKKAGSAPLIFGGSCWRPNITLRNFKVFSSAAEPSILSFTDNQVCPETTYNYKVASVKNGLWTGPASNPAGNVSKALLQPRSMTATTASDIQINLSITPSVDNDQSGFKLIECIGTTCSSEIMIPNSSTQIRTGLLPETSYCHQVAAWRESSYCNGGAGITSPFTSAANCQTTHTARAGNLTARALNANKILLEWDDMSGNEDKFLIQRKIWNGQWIVRESSYKTRGKGSKQTFVDTIGIEPLKQYTYRIVALKGNIESPPSNEAIVTYTDPKSGQTIYTTPAFTGGIEKATCVCTTIDGKEVCK